MIRFCQRPPDHHPPGFCKLPTQKVRSRPSWRFMVTEERALVSVIGPTAGSDVRIEHWRYTAAFSKGPSRSWHTVFLNPPGIRYEGRIGDRHVDASSLSRLGLVE